MIEKEIKNSFVTFNDLTNNLINAFMKSNLDERTVVLLAKMTKHLMSFTHKILLRLLFKFLKTISFFGNKFTDDLVDVDEIVDLIFDQINISLNNLLNSENDKNKQDDIDDIIENLKFLKDVINSLSNLFLSVVKFEAEVISEEEFREDYRQFKKDIFKYKDILGNLLYKEMVEVPIT